MTRRPFLLAAAAFLSASAVDAATLDDIARDGRIDIGVRQDARPFSFIDEDGKAAGYSVDLCDRVTRAIAEQIGSDGLETEFHLVTAEDRLEKVENGEVDLVCGATTNTLQRQERVGFSLLTFITGADMMMRADANIAGLGDLAGKPVGVREGTTTERGFKAALARAGIDAEVTAFDSHNEGLGALVTGEIEAYVADRVLLIGLRENSPSASELKLSGNFFSYEPYALPLRRDDPEFKLAVDRALAGLYRSGAIGEIFSKWFPGARPSDLLQALFVLQGLPEE